MCGRYNEHLQKMHGWGELLQQWPEKDEWRFNVYPTATVAAFYDGIGKPMRWQMVPPWAKEFSVKYPTHNARVETVDEKPTFRNAWSKGQRCLIPMAGFYERQRSGSKQWYYITDDAVGGLVAAGLYEQWGDQYSCTMITKESEGDFADIHHRTPILLDPDAGAEWLSSSLMNPFQMLNESYITSLDIYPISDGVGKAENNDASIIEPQAKVPSLFD